MTDDNCPNAQNHTKAPRGYLAWHEWAEEMMETHMQIICEGCGRYAIWIMALDRATRTGLSAYEERGMIVL